MGVFWSRVDFAMMQLFVRQVGGDLLSLSVNETDTVASLRETVCSHEGEAVLAEDLRLCANGTDLGDSQILGECLLENATLEALLRLRGGGKKRKKNNFKPKKIKHKHKNVPMATLKFYKIDSQGKI